MAYLSGVQELESHYAGAGKAFYPLIALLHDGEEEPSDLDELLGTCTFKKADDMEPDGVGLEPFYTDTFPEKIDDYIPREEGPLFAEIQASA